MDLNFVKLAYQQKVGSSKVKSYSKEIWGPTKKLGGTEDLKKQIAHKKQNPEVCLRRDDRVLQNKFTQLILICNNTQKKKKKRQTII
jgi:hypothetical protein